MADDNQRIIHSQLKLSNGTVLFVCDEFPERVHGKTAKLTENQYNSVTLNLSYLNHDSAKVIWDKIKASQPSGLYQTKYKIQIATKTYISICTYK